VPPFDGEDASLLPLYGEDMAEDATPPPPYALPGDLVHVHVFLCDVPTADEMMLQCEALGEPDRVLLCLDVREPGYQAPMPPASDARAQLAGRQASAQRPASQKTKAVAPPTAGGHAPTRTTIGAAVSAGAPPRAPPRAMLDAKISIVSETSVRLEIALL
jgi:hypothetical protein